MSDIVKRLNENIIADAFENRAIVDGALCERLIRERKEAAETIEKLRAALKPFAELGEMVNSYEPDDCEWEVTSGMLRAAAAALKEMGE